MKDDSIIDLSKLGEEETSLKPKNIGDEFHIGHLDDNILGSVTKVDEYEFKDTDEFLPLVEKLGKKSEIEAVPSDTGGASDKVRIKFDKFVTLVATHTYEDILKKNAGEEVIVSTNLLTDLANAHDEETPSKKWPLLFAVGIILGTVIGWLIFKG